MSTHETVNFASSEPTWATPGPGYPPQSWDGMDPVGGWAPPAPPPRRPSWSPLAVAIVITLVIAVGAIGLVTYIAMRPNAGDMFAAAVEDTRNWEGATYRGSVTDYQGVQIDFDITVTAEGAKGTLSRDGGRSKAEVAQDRSGVLLKANQEWWQRTYPAKAAHLADTWVTDPGSETSMINSILQLTPAALARDLNPSAKFLWKQEREDVVDGQRAIVLTGGLRTAIVTADAPYRLLSVDVQTLGGGKDEPARVIKPSPEQIAAAKKAGAAIRAQSPKSLNQKLFERAEPRIKVHDAPTCVTPTCTFTVTVTNTGELAATGTLEITVDGRVAASHPLNVLPGQSADFTATVDNPSAGRPGASGTFYVYARIVDA
jgi:hypothetical protein